MGSVCDDRARKILRRAMQENRMVHVMWSGGIDSTTALVALLRVGTERQLSRVKILYTKESCREYPLLFAVLCKLAGVTLGESGSPGMEKKRIGNWRKERGKWMSLRMWSRRNELSDAHGNEATMDDLVKADEIVERVMREQYLRIIEGQKEEYVGEGEEMEDLSKTTNVPLWNPMIPIRLVRLQSLSEIYDPVVDDFGKESEGNRISETTTSSTDRDNSNPSESEGRTGLGGRIGDERRKPLLVTGEHGDQIFGSMYMRYFYDVDESVTHSTLSPLPSSSPSLSKFSSSSTHNRARTLFSSARNNTQPRAGGKGNGDGLIPPIAQRLLRGTQLEPWRAIMPGFFVAARAIPVAARGKWLEWMEKQTNQAPVPIVSVFDYLWWISFSMKWQHVALRILAADGERENSVLQNRYERTVHFFNTDGFQLWSMRNHHRNRKMSDINKWSTYKVRFREGRLSRGIS